MCSFVPPPPLPFRFGVGDCSSGQPGRSLCSHSDYLNLDCMCSNLVNHSDGRFFMLMLGVLLLTAHSFVLEYFEFPWPQMIRFPRTDRSARRCIRGMIARNVPVYHVHYSVHAVLACSISYSMPQQLHKLLL